MYKFDNQLFDQDRYSPLGSLLLLLVVIFFGAFMGAGLSQYATSFLFGLSTKDLMDPDLAAEGAEVRRSALIFYQAANHFFIFLITPLVYLYPLNKKQWHHLNAAGKVQVKWVLALVGLTFLISYFFLPLNSVIIEWNSNIKFSGALQSFGESARMLEDKAQKVTSMITTFTTPGDLFLGLFVIGLLPAVGEELVFRGLMQNVFHRLTRNPHAAVLLSAFVFSAIHMQIFGFVPRFLLGALFGYLYLWSKNIWIPIWAHFVNNGGTVFMMYLYQQKLVSFDIEQEQDAFSASSLLIHTGIFAGCLYLFWKLARQRDRISNESTMGKSI